jgi:hypothetical protein
MVLASSFRRVCEFLGKHTGNRTRLIPGISCYHSIAKLVRCIGVFGEDCFHPRASRPAAFGYSLEGCRLARVQRRPAHRAIEQDSISRITEPCAQGRKPEISSLALRSGAAKRAGYLAVDKGAVEIPLGAIDERVGLEIDAERGTGQETPEIEIAGRPTGDPLGSLRLLAPKP